MTAQTIVHLPDLEGPAKAPEASCWKALAVEVDPLTSRPQVAVPSLDDARACAHVRAGEVDLCAPRVISFDPPDGTTLIALGAGNAVVRVRVSPAFPPDAKPVLTLHPVSFPHADVTIDGQVAGRCRDELVFPDAITPATPDGEYSLSVEGYPGEQARIAVDLIAPDAARPTPDPCAVTLAPAAEPVGLAIDAPPAAWPRPPLLAVDAHGCVVAAWSVDDRGRVLVPRDDGGVDLLQSCHGGTVASIKAARDAIFWQGTIAVLTSAAVWLYDLSGCPLTPAPFSSGLGEPVGLAISEKGFLIVVQRTTPNLILLRRDGSRALPPGAFDGRGWYARHRSPVFSLDAAMCAYTLDPSKVGSGCGAAPARPLTPEEALFFQLIDDLPELRRRIAYPTSGWAILGPATPEDPLDAGRPGTQWHRIVLFGEIPGGCAVQIQTRAFDDFVAGDPLIETGWSPPVTASPASAGSVEAPGDTRVAAADALVLAGPGRYLWMRLTLQGDGRSTPRVTAIEIQRPREGTARFLPKVYRDSTPEDDFLRRWLTLFEATAWSGIAQRMDAYAELFDPRTAPVEMLPYLAGWLEIQVIGRFLSDPDRLRRLLLHADGLARTRGTLEGLVLIVKLYLGITVQLIESFRTRSRFILGCGLTISGITGPVLGCDTIATPERSPTWLGDEARLGCSFLLECDERAGTVPHHFDVIVSARAICSSEDLSLLRSLIEAEKPAHTTFRIHPVAPAGWVVGVASIIGQEVGPSFNRRRLDPASYGIVILNGPPRPKPLGEGFMLGFDARLAATSEQSAFRLDATVGRTTRVGA